jgi:hypothetical protein
MRKFLSGILTSLLFSASLFGISSPANADEVVQPYSNPYGADIQPFVRSDRDVMNPDNTSRSPENATSPGERATDDPDSYQRPSQRPHRFGSGNSSEFYLFR